ncbi:MAG: sensor histidine kinase [Cytophagaceae bacterium]
MADKNPEYYIMNVLSDIKGFAIFMMDEHGIIQTWNHGCELLKGYKPEEAIGQNYAIMFPDFLREKNFPENELEEASKQGRFESVNWRRQKNGDLFWAYVVLTKVTNDKTGEFIGYIKITQDYSDRKNFEIALKKEQEKLLEANAHLAIAREELIATHAELIIRKNAELDKTNQDLDNFIYTASHELKSPIANMEGLLNALSESETWYDEETRPLFQMMDKSVAIFKNTIHNLAEISLVQRSHQDDYQEIDVKKVIEEVAFRLRGQIDKKGAVIHTDCTDCKTIQFSAKDFRSILYNLVSNSIKFASPERCPEIFIKTSIQGEFTVLIVTDNGLGIDKKNQKKVFAWFKRFHDHVEETGLGLYTVKRIVENAGGKVEIESKLGTGTTFKIFFKNKHT